ncbi:hypothetical protein E1176_05985 [Fulvivirga sp. RKSG066]|uniref:lamin tail domain-containing protein n=1 Tax=Fulvivirga aurantia TaxID=2529383 RepID=UPI0012BD31DD|nr:lamin tail domain-containing protein [Fulvivirga aurantia]MTI20563.1 hypothetical protein [Fulvivirga aurantia]
MFLNRFYLVSLFTICFHLSQAQFVDDFSDGDFTNNPTWVSSNESGAGTDFQVSGGQLQSNGPTATSTLYITTSNTFSEELNTTWQFKVVYNNAPSSSNSVKVFLVSDRENLKDSPVGYYIQLGESGSGDGIDLYKTSSGTPIIEDPTASISSVINVHIKVTRSSAGDWKLEADTSGGNSFLTIGEGIDTEFQSGSHFGFLVKHTSTRSQDFFFDDVSVTTVDNVPPKLEEILVLDENSIEIQFSEKVDQASALTTTNYFVDKGVGSPNSATYNGNDSTRVKLSFSESFINASEYTLSVERIEDSNGNMIMSTNKEFLYFLQPVVKERDIIFNELMADPEPPNDLPPAEYIELYNRSENVIDLKNWIYADAKSSTVLPSDYIYPGQYILICASSDTSLFESYGHVIGLSPWPSLNNPGDVLTLKNELGATVDSVAFDDTWYGSSTKKEGGWSLELIDPENKCGGDKNWDASENSEGGTPGIENSVKSDNPDLIGPMLINAWALSTDSLLIRFNERLEENSIIKATINLTPELAVNKTYPVADLESVVLSLNSSMIPDEIYTIAVDGVKDCSGNLITENTVNFRLPETPSPQNLIINEVLYDPRPEGVDFVEVYNRSDKYITLDSVYLARGEYTEDSLSIISSKLVAEEPFIMAPGDYVAFTEDEMILKEQYPLSRAENLVSTDLPTYVDNEGVVVLMLGSKKYIDAFSYNDELHSPLLDDTEGTSLERVNTEVSAENKSNWKSAVASVGFATPGYENSQSRREALINNESIEIEPKIIDPLSTSNNFTSISYNFPNARKAATVMVYDIQGRLVKTIAQNYFLSDKGFFTWDGTNEDGSRVDLGYYLIFFEVFDASGEVQLFKEKVAVGRRF